MKTTTIESIVGISPEFLSKGDIKKAVRNKIDEIFLNKCYYEHGFIVKILYKSIKILENETSLTDSNINFKISFKVYVVKPEKYDKIKCKVNMIFNHGVFAGIYNLKILIPKNELKEYEFMKIDDSSVFKSKKSKISVDDEVMCEITAIRYDKKQYSCIGKLIQ